MQTITNTEGRTHDSKNAVDLLLYHLHASLLAPITSIGDPATSAHSRG